MPFTFAHPAAILPLHKALGRRVSISALAIGSMSPDLVLFLPLESLVPGEMAHSLFGLPVFCLPAGLICYLVFHLFLKRPACALLPWRFSQRLAVRVFESPLLPATPWLVVAASLVLGAFTHIAWDAFTHFSSPIVQEFAVFRTLVGTVGGYKIHLFKILQHLSSVVGLAALALAVAAWAKAHPVHAPAPAAAGATRCAPVGETVGASAGGTSAWTAGAAVRETGAKGRSLAPGIRAWVVVCIGAASMAAGAVNSLSAHAASFERSLFHLVVGAIVGGALSLAVFALFWHVRVALLKQAGEDAAGNDAVVDGLYSGPKAALRPAHDKVMAAIEGFGPFEIAPKKGYLSLRRKKQFAMVGPATNTRIEIGLNMKGVAATERLVELPPGGMCNYRVRLASVDEVDAELLGWIRLAFDSAGGAGGVLGSRVASASCSSTMRRR